MLEVVAEEFLVATNTEKTPIKTKIAGKFDPRLELPIIDILGCLEREN